MILPPRLNRNRIEAGCDEAGRGCLAGPVFAAAVILTPDFAHEALNDSKQMSEEKRYELRALIEKEALAWAVAELSPKEIDRYNILKSSFMAMHRAVKKLQVTPQHLLIDGNRFLPYPNIEHTCIIKGDGKYAHIAAASVLAKTYRDDYMKGIHTTFPMYNWQKNKGYPTKEHRAAIYEHGASKHHRQSFKLLPEDKQGSLF